MPIQKPNFDLSEEYRQLALGLDLPEVELEGVSPEEARLRSEEARRTFENGEASEEYRMLRDEGWPWRQAAYIAWAATPKPRKPKTQEELAVQVLGLSSDRAVNIWRKKNPMIDERVAVLQGAQLWNARADILKALVENASKADYKTHNDRKVALEMLGDYVPASKLSAELTKKLGSGDLSSLSDAELEALSVSVEQELKREKGEENAE